MNTEIQKFGDYLVLKRKAKGLTIKQLSSLLGISFPYLSDVENSRRNPFPPETLELIPEALGLTEDETCTLYYLAGRDKGTIAHDIADYVASAPQLQMALRKAKALGITDDEWRQLVDELCRRRE